MTISEQFVPNRELPKNLSGIKMSSDHLIDSSSHEALMRSEQVSQSFKPQIANLVDSMIGRVE
jgi:sugar-specific transcriptional regulator TrmB